MKEILDEYKIVCFIDLYPPIVQINRAKNLSDEPLKLSPSFFMEGFIGQYSAIQARDNKPPPPLSVFFPNYRRTYMSYYCPLIYKY